MKKNSHKFILTASLGLLSLVAIATSLVRINNQPVESSLAWSGEQTPNIGNYYSGVSDDLTGSSLQAKLKQINPSMKPDYDWSRYEAADEAEGSTTEILCIYTRHKINKNSHCGSYAWDKWNREHIWTQSAYPKSASDNHNIFACEGQINNIRNNYGYAEVPHTTANRQVVFGHTTDCYFNGSKFEPPDEAKGEVVRALMYGCVIYDYTLSNMIPVATALKWNLEHPITNRDIYRNNKVQQLQGNRNPFVDHPEYACKIWGNTNDDTKDICGLSGPSVKSVSVSPTAATIYLDKDTHKQLTATVSVTGGAAQTVNWASNNTSVATVSNTGYVTALAEGSATITATSTFDSSKKGTCTITVKETGGTDPAVNSVTVTPSSYTMILKDDTHKQLTATVDVEGDAPTTVTWSTSNSAVATVNASGVVTGKSAGTAVITATSTFDNTKKGTCTLTVENQEEDIVIDNENVVSDVGTHFDLTVTSKDGGDITWTWDDYVEKFLSIPKNVTASGEILTIIVKGNGYAELTATETNGHSVVCYIVAGTGVMDPDEDPDTPIKPKQQSNASMPTWSWFAIGGGSALLIAGVVLLIIFIKKRPA